MQIKDLVGKQILIALDSWNDKVYFRFTDNTVAVIEAHTRYYGEISLTIDNKVEGWARVQLGLITEEQYNKEEEEAKKHREAESQQRERQWYEQLKQKFEGK